MSTLELPKRILVVEDDPTIRLILVRSFNTKSIVLEAEDGAQGLAVVVSDQPDFVITDLSLPRMDGSEMISRIRRTSVGACIPIMVLTANGKEQVLLESFRSGADDFMVKPFSISELRVRVASIYLRQKIAREANPLTNLPGNVVIKSRIADRLRAQEPFAVAYIDIDYFKAFNDSRGFDAGDEVIQLLGSILVRQAEASMNEVFVGHIGGDDFVALMPPEKVEGFADSVFEMFEAKTRSLYSSRELEEGAVEIVTRRAKVERVPLLSISIGVVSSDRPGLDDFRKITHVAAEVKRMAKKTAGNSLFVERRRNSPA